MRLALLLLVSGCNQAALTPNSDGGQDLRTAAQDLLTAPQDLRMAGFCGDPSSPRIEVNGMLAASPAVTGNGLVFSCCEGAEFQIVSMQIPEPMVFAWRLQLGGGSSLPATIDLANPPPEWSFTLWSGCTSSQTGCMPTDSYASGFTGSLTVSHDPSGYHMSVCLEVTESAAMPHPVLHSVKLWSPTLTAQ